MTEAPTDAAATEAPTTEMDATEAPTEAMAETPTEAMAETPTEAAAATETTGETATAATTAPVMSGDPIRIGSKNFTEQLILGEMYAQLLEAAGIEHLLLVEHKSSST